ncbi:MAG TPA: NTP transferase domain-containing protein, partial [Gemmatales bacterium]|nr:NTP transferase domain-containing protein [Gemmatales bacterium]
MTICKPVSPKLCSTIILAGGASKRMGRDKATLPWNGKTLLEDLVQRFHQYSSKILVVAAIQQKIPPLPEHVHLVHDASAFPGPLWGLYYGLRAVMHSGPVFVTGCDYPLLPAEL